MLKCYASDEGFEEFSFMVETYAKFKNSHLFFDLCNEDPIIIQSEIVSLEGLIKEHIEVGEL
jgi:hypothetical protein